MTLRARLRALEQQVEAVAAQFDAIREQVAAIVSELEGGEAAPRVSEFRFPKKP